MNFAKDAIEKESMVKLAELQVCEDELMAIIQRLSPPDGTTTDVLQALEGSKLVLIGIASSEILATELSMAIEHFLRGKKMALGLIEAAKFRAWFGSVLPGVIGSGI